MYDILGYSANIDAKNLYEKTPLHMAAENGKSVEIIRALLAHNAKIAAKDSKGNTALNYAVKRTDRKYEVIKELVMHGAIVTLVKYEDWNVNHRTPLDDAVLLDDMECIKVLIKYYVLHKLPPSAYNIALGAYFRNNNFRVMRDFHARCCKELDAMEKEIVNDKAKTSLLQVVRKKFVCRDALGKDQDEMDAFAEKCLGIVRSIKYPIYNEDVMSKLKIKLEKKCLMNNLDTIEVYSNLEQKVALNLDSTKALARFLPRNDLFNMIIAFSVPSTIPPEKDNVCWGEHLRREVLKRLAEPSTSFCAFKLPKLE